MNELGGVFIVDAPSSGHQSGDGTLPKISLPTGTWWLRFDNGRSLLAAEWYLASTIVGLDWLLSNFHFWYGSLLNHKLLSAIELLLIDAAVT